MKIINDPKEFKKLPVKTKKVKYQNVVYTRHKNPKGLTGEGLFGGFVAKTAEVDDTAYISLTAQVHGNAQVFGAAWICDDSQVYGFARIYGRARICDKAKVGDNAEVSGNAWVYGNAQIRGDARIYGNARISGNAQIQYKAQVCGGAHVYGRALVAGHAWIYGNAAIFDDTITTILKTIQVFDYCVSITSKYVFCGCFKWPHSRIESLTYEKAKVNNFKVRTDDYMSRKQFEIIKKAVLLIIKY